MEAFWGVTLVLLVVWIPLMMIWSLRDRPLLFNENPRLLG